MFDIPEQSCADMLKTRKGIATVKNKWEPAFPNPNQIEKVILMIISRIVRRTIYTHPAMITMRTNMLRLQQNPGLDLTRT